MSQSMTDHISLFAPGEFDGYNPSFLANPYPTFHAMRTTQPIYRWQRKNAWLLTRYVDARYLLRSSHFAFANPLDRSRGTSPEWGEVMATPKGPAHFAHLRLKAQTMLQLWFPIRNPPDHTRLRHVTEPPLTRHNVAGLQEEIQKIADELLDKVERTGEMDVLADYATPLMQSVMSHTFGTHFEEHNPSKALILDLIKLLDIEPDPKTYERGLFALIKLLEYFRTRDGTEIVDPYGWLSLLEEAEHNGTMSGDERLANLVMLLIAGNDAPPQSITVGILRLLQNPDQLHLLQTQPNLIKTAVDELLRYDPVITYTLGQATRDTTIGEQAIRQGESVYALLGGANHDPEIFEDPDRLDITRSPNPHLSFGQGIHYCLGTHLGRLEAQIGIGTLVRRFPRLALASPEVQWGPSFRNRGLVALPVTF